MSKEQVFKEYHQNQTMFLPPDLEDLIPENHLVRVVSSTVDKLDHRPLIEAYKGGGTSAYHPVMMLKVILYAYTSKIYTSRKIAKAIREDINFMWLSARNRPDFRTINIFRSGKLKPIIDDLFSSFLKLLSEEGYIRLEHYCVDGTNIRANAGKYSHVWKKNSERYKKNTEEKIKDILRYIDELTESENQIYGDRDLEELGQGKQIDSVEFQKKLSDLKDKLDERIKKSTDKEEKKELKSCRTAVKDIEKKHLPKLEKYKDQLSILGNRNSYSKTDPDATFLRDKDDQILPGYKILFGTENQFILNYSIHQNPAENVHFKPHIEKFQRLMGKFPKDIVGDSAYGNEENYEFLDENGIGNYLKYPTFHKGQSKQHKNNPYHRDNFKYDPVKDEFICPNNRRLLFKEIKQETRATGYTVNTRVYECNNCKDCSLALLCKKGIGNRQVQINPKLEYYKEKAKENLTSEKGLRLRKKRNYDVEAVIGHIKWNGEFRRFLLRGLQKVNVEIGLLSFAHNIKKMAKKISKKPKKCVAEAIFYILKHQYSIFNIQYHLQIDSTS